MAIKTNVENKGATPEYVVEVQGLNKSYGKHQVLKDISFNVMPNEIVGFIGPNGAGKSTTMKCLCNLIFPDSGSIKINGFDLFRQREQALSHQAALIEAPGLFLDMSGRENIMLIAKLRKISKARVQEIVDFTEIGKALDRKVSGYSMGMKQRLGLGIAIMTKPKFLILDEPTNGLDPTGIIHLRHTLQNLIAQEDISILFSSHQLGEVEKLADRIICINKGQLIETPKALGEKYSYMIQVVDQAQALVVLAGIVAPERLQAIGKDSVRVELEDAGMLNSLLGVLSGNRIDVLDLYKDSIDVESVYRDVYGA